MTVRVLPTSRQESVKSHGAAAMVRAVKELYMLGQTDYSFTPIVMVNGQGQPVGAIMNGDGVIFCCRRGEREIQLTEAFTAKDFPHFDRPDLSHLNFVILTLYHDKFKDLPVAFAPGKITGTLAEAVSSAGLRQFHTSESEKFAHVTFFLNGGHNEPFPGELDACVPSLKGIPFDTVPELSLPGVVEQVKGALAQEFDLIVANFANGDVIGHTANNEAKVRCAALMDQQLAEVLKTARAAGYVTFITADHGNLEEMLNPDGSANVAHTTNPVPFILVDPAWKSTCCLCDGSLADLAPTVLEALGVEPPAQMQGKSLAPGYPWNGKRKVLLLILDGWGLGKKDETNPIHLAQTPVWDDLLANYPFSQLKASGPAVGLGAGKNGNSEAGHMNIGAGRVILQDDVRLEKALEDGSFDTNEVFIQTIERVKQNGTALHLIGLLTEKSSHGSIDYPLALLRLAKKAGLEKAFLHIIFDGRSTQPGSAPQMLEKLEMQMNEIGLGQVASGVGRGITLDRDGNYARTKQAFDALVSGIGKTCLFE